jgi:hypothetical protein
VSPGNDKQYNPTIKSIVPAGAGFTITGTGFRAASYVYAQYSFTALGDTNQTQWSSFTSSTDFGGIFVQNSEIVGLGATAGNLQITMYLPEAKAIFAQWTGDPGRMFNITSQS